MRLSVGIDIGGTFTDVVAADADSGEFWSAKILSDSTSLTGKLLGALADLRERCGAAPGEMESITVGHTIALNALLERRGARTALITTAGFRDVLQIGRESRAALFDLQQDPRPMLVPRHLRFEITERMDATGTVVRPLALGELDELIARMRAFDVTSVAVCLLHSYANPSHEVAIAEALRSRCPDLAVCASHEVLSEHREYERTVLTVLNAYVTPRVASFMDELSIAVGESEQDALLAITDSAGGAMSAVVSRSRAIHSAFSGPASGVRAAALIAAQVGYRDLLTLDIGGTSCDVGMVRNGEPVLSNRTVLAGFPLGLQSAEIESVSAGGGSIAWIDAGGLLRVGPRSAGAVPGPACYGRGGTEPTVTDAHLVLGHLDAGQALGGELRLDIELARAAISEHIAEPLAMSCEEAAAGIIAIAQAGLVRALEVISIERGYDPREAALVAFGGAGPLHAGPIALAVGITRVIIPADAGVLCALGALSAEERYEFSQSQVRSRAGDEPRAWLRQVKSELYDRAAALIADLGERFICDYYLEMRYVGQTATIPIVAEIEADDVLDSAHKQFEQAYTEVFGYSMPRPSEVESVRLIAHRTRTAGAFETVRRAVTDRPRPWRAHFGEHGFLDCTIADSAGLGVGMPLLGPAILVSPTSTAVVMPGQSATLDPTGTILLEPAVAR